MPVYKIDQVETLLASKMVQLINYVVDDVYEKLRENIVDKAYSTQDNTDYFNGTGRTDEFLESFQKDEIKQELRTIIGRIFQDINVMGIRQANPSHIWNKHESVWGDDIRSGLANILNSTNTGMWTGSREGHFWDDTINYIETNLDEIVLKGANKYGIPIKRG